MRNQLFSIHSVDIPYSVTRFPGGHHVDLQFIQSLPFMYWPNGKPCDPVNMYLISVADLATGETLKTYASQLTHLVRYCGTINISFGELTDTHFFSLSNELKNQKSHYDLNEPARNNNTIRAILGRIILFVLWYQKTLYSLLARPLIGEPSISPLIQVRKLVNRHSGKCYYIHRAMPPPESRDPKRPIAQPVIEDIERCIDTLSLIENQKGRFKQRFKKCPERLIAQLEYMRCRRHFMVWLMKRTGLRPSEMVEISVKKHLDVLRKKVFFIPTKKRRLPISPIRSFRVVLKDAATFLRYLTARNKFVCILNAEGLSVENSDAIFLGVNGVGIRKTTLERDFARIVETAGYKDVQACFSMFRHRFITYEVIVHIKEFMDKSKKSRGLMTDKDYQSILKRVAVKTGHGSIESLWHYIDLAWEETDVWGSIDKAIERFHGGDRFFEEILDLDFETGKMADLCKSDIIKYFKKRLDEILNSGASDLGTGRHVGH